MVQTNDSGFIACPVCGEAATFYCRKDSSTYYRSSNCGLIFQHPLPSMHEMKNYAQDEYSGGLYKEYVKAKDLKYETFRRRIPKILALLHHTAENGIGKLLDIGCSCGYFLDVALEAGFDAYGIEFSNEAISLASRAAKSRITQGDINIMSCDQAAAYDVVTAFDIIEHTDAPISFLKNLKSILKPGGVLVLTSPDTGHFLRPIMGRRWPMLQALQHTHLFSKKSIFHALDAAGFRDIDITDAYKVLTIDYLMGQLKINNPTFYRLYRLISPTIPNSLHQKQILLNIGEILAVGRRPKRI